MIGDGVVGLFSRKKEKQKEDVTKLLQEACDLCKKQNCAGVNIADVCWIPIGYARAYGDSNYIKKGRQCTIETIIFSAFVCFSSAIYPCYKNRSARMYEAFRKSVEDNIANNICSLYGISEFDAYEMTRNRFDLYSYPSRSSLDKEAIVNRATSEFVNVICRTCVTDRYESLTNHDNIPTSDLRLLSAVMAEAELYLSRLLSLADEAVSALQDSAQDYF